MRDCAYRPGLQLELRESTVKGECISEMEGYSDILTGSDYTPAGPRSCGSASYGIFLPYEEDPGTQKGYTVGRRNDNSPLQGPGSGVLRMNSISYSETLLTLLYEVLRTRFHIVSFTAGTSYQRVQVESPN